MRTRHLIIFLILLLPLVTVAAGLVPCNGFDCKWKDLIGPDSLAQRVLNWIFIIAIPLASIVIVYAGITMVMTPYNASKRDEAKKILGTAIWGLVMVAAAWVIIHSLLAFLGSTFQI